MPLEEGSSYHPMDAREENSELVQWNKASKICWKHEKFRKLCWKSKKMRGLGQGY